jgi:hypothetical protein
VQDFSPLHIVRTGSGAHPAICPVGMGAVSLPGCETDHSTPSSADGQEYVALYIHSPIRLHGVVLNCPSTGETLRFEHKTAVIHTC